MNEFEKVVVDIGKGIAYPFSHAAKLVALIEAGMKDTPAAKAALIGLIQKGESLVTGGTATGVAVAAATAGDGINLAADAAAAVAVETEAKNAETFWQYFTTTFIPEVEAIWKDVEAVVGSPTVATTTTTTTTITTPVVEG